MKECARAFRRRSRLHVQRWPKRSAANHVTLELPTGPNAASSSRSWATGALKKKIYAAYHTHTQGSMTVFDQAFALSKGNMANVDLGHWTAGGNMGGTPMQFLEKFHDRDLELPPQGQNDAGTLRAQSGVGHGRDADQGNPSVGAEEQVEVPGVDRARIQRARGLGRREGSQKVPGVLPGRARGEVERHTTGAGGGSSAPGAPFQPTSLSNHRAHPGCRPAS